MYFLHPEILWWLFLALIPVIIHLFNFRRYRKIYFSDVSLLKNILKQTKKQNKLKHFIVLLTRIFAVASIVIAFAGPRLGDRHTGSVSKVKSLYIDNSFSMEGETERGMAFEVARNLATEIIKSSENDVRFLIQTNDYFSGKRTVSKKEALNSIEKLKISPVSRKFSDIDIRQKKLLKNIESYNSYWFSDFQKYAFDIENFINDSVNRYIFLPVKHTNNKNIYVDTCYFTKPVILPGSTAKLKTVIKNASSAAYEKIPVKLFINGKQKNVEGIDLLPHKSKEVEFEFIPYETGWQYGKITIEDYPVTFDDDLLFSFKINKRIKILDINNGSPNKYLQTFYLSDTSFDFHEQKLSHLNTADFKMFDLIILDEPDELTSGITESLKNFLKSGGNVLLIPGINSDINSINLFLKSTGGGKLSSPDTSETRVKNINIKSPVFKEIISKIPANPDLPKVKFHYPFKYHYTSGYQSLVNLLNGDEFIVSKNTDNGNLFILTAPLDKKVTDLMFNPLFTGIMFGPALTSANNSKLFYTIGKDDKITLPYYTGNKDKVFTFMLKDSDYEFIPGQKTQGGKTTFFINNLISKAGYYQGILNDSVYFVVAYNYDRKESDPDFYSAETLDSLLRKSPVTNYKIEFGEINNIRKVINDERKGSQLWKLFIIFALLMLLAEALILRLWK